MAEETRLAAELERLEARTRLSVDADEALEVAMRDRWPLSRTLDELMPLLAEHVRAAGVKVTTFDEDLALRSFSWGVAEGSATVSHRLDAAGEDFGRAELWLGAEADHAESQKLLVVWCEELDNYLAAIARARRKHAVTSKLSDALKHPVLATGIVRAIDVLKATVSFDDLILAYHHEEDHRGETTSFTVVQAGEIVASSSSPRDTEAQRSMTDGALAFILGEVHLPVGFGMGHPREEVLINGVKDERVIGRLVVNRREGELNTYDRDLLDRFADYLRQRIVDFNREYKHLALNFPAGVVRRLLAEEDYERNFLLPRERDIAIMFTDIAGFTRASEQVLRSPDRIGKLIEIWSNRVVRILWEAGGVFDKMVGDCIIGLWGPPFFDTSPQQACEKALGAAREIRQFTRSLSQHEALPELREAGIELSVATGLNFCPASVGLFGPNLDYTAFGAGMNNASRLQGLAKGDEILCMDRFVEQLADTNGFSEVREAAVKNVEHPLRFRAAR